MQLINEESCHLNHQHLSLGSVITQEYYFLKKIILWKFLVNIVKTNTN